MTWLFLILIRREREKALSFFKGKTVMEKNKRRYGIKKAPDKLTVLRDALTGSEKTTGKVMRAFQTLMRQDSEESDRKPGGMQSGRKRKTPPLS